MLCSLSHIFIICHGNHSKYVGNVHIVINMNCTTFYLKLFTESVIKDLNVKSFKKHVKLNYPIRNAKFIEISNLFAKDTILFVESDLVDEDYSYSNIVETGVFGGEFPSQMAYFGYGGNIENNKKIKIRDSKSLINEFTIKVSTIQNNNFSRDEIFLSFVCVNIYHEATNPCC